MANWLSASENVSPMSSHMALKIYSLWKILWTFFTNKWFLPGMSSHVNLQTSSYLKRLCAFFADKWFLSRMSSEVGLQLACISKWLETFFTCKWLLSWMISWLLRCFFISPPLINDWEHALQVNGFSPECVPRWILREYDRENDLEHSLQINGFSPECVQRCLFL